MVQVLFYVQSLLGRGHLVRAAAVCEALRAGGFRVLLADGGGDFPPLHAGIERLRLPAVRTADVEFSKLIKADGSDFTDTDKARRKEALFSAYRDFAPQIVIVEGYPLARRAFAFELDSVLQHAGENGILRMTSVRDIVVFDGAEDKRQRILQKLSLIDKIWVHGDEDFCPLGESLDFAHEVADKIVYSGYVGAGECDGKEEGDGRIIVSGGGGAAAAPLYHALLPLAEQLSQYRWLFLLGENFPDKQNFAARSLPPHLQVADNHPNFRRLLRGAKLAIGQVGYNTVMDIVAEKTPCLLHAFAGNGGETEQPLRAGLLQKHGLAHVLPADLSSLTAEGLHAIMEKAMRKSDTAAFKIATPQELSAQLHELWKDHVE